VIVMVVSTPAPAASQDPATETANGEEVPKAAQVYAIHGRAGF
jgi:hypothetical protein